MNWCCFKFWLVWRFVMASLAHFNWFTAIYINCLYFTLWKSYDLLWFWTHLLLCICLKPLRSENFLLVICNLFMAKRKAHNNKSYQQIYNILYNQRFTKSERELRRIETIERRRYNMNQHIDDRGLNSDSSSDNDSHVSPQQKFKSMNQAYTRYPRMDEIEEQAMPSINVDRSKPTKTISFVNDVKVLLMPTSASKNGDGNSEIMTSTSSSETRRIANFLPSRIVSQIFRKTVGENHSLSSNEKALVEREKMRLKEEKRLQKAQQKEENSRRKAELKAHAKIERRRRNLALAIDLLLTWLRLMTTFAILVGNIHKTFMPSYLITPSQNFYDKPDLLMLFTVTMSLDILLFWFMVFWTYCQQCQLCCRLGICRFSLWLMALSFLGGICMYMPMHYIHQQLDLHWCALVPGSDINEYFEG